MTYNLLIEDLNITLISNSEIINTYSNNLIEINNLFINIQNNIDFLISKITKLRLRDQINKLRDDINSLVPQSIETALARNLPNINVDPNAQNNLIKIIHESQNTIFNNNDQLILSEDFSLKFENMNKVFRVKYSNTNVNNLIVYVYGFENEVINVVETNIENISNYIANVYYSDVSINQSLDVVNLLVKEEENYKLLIIDGSTRRVLASVNINILGNNPVNHPIGTPYVDAGATATDSLGQLIEAVVTNNVNSDIEGKYNVIYKATDGSGNDIEKVRIVNVA
jgi:hypothetical protein